MFFSLTKHHLQNNLRHTEKKIAFVVDKSTLAKQQADAIKHYVACRLKVISGDTMREEKCIQLSRLLLKYDIFVITAQMLVNAMDKEDLSIDLFTLIIFDECHHCYGGHAFYKVMIPYHDKMLSDMQVSDQQELLPQVVGFTASIGVGNARALENVVDHVKAMMANLDADVLVTVQENIEELNEKIKTPDQSIVVVPTRITDVFRTRIESLMIQTEEYLRKILEKFGEHTPVHPPIKKGNEQYTQWLEDDLLTVLGNTKDDTLSRLLHTIRSYLQIYNDGLIIHSYVRASDSLNYIIRKIEDLPNPSTTSEQDIKHLFESKLQNIYSSFFK
ncbi:antiviral innate immune response receptor RIG-I-like [Saccostrea cucullata]|uniref:antiviral innate immune response receptor RIG-I-like n=1 Tax=Saccostrea cuccullata TaxID=36930 RepID=UPI002ED3AE68